MAPVTYAMKHCKNPTPSPDNALKKKNIFPIIFKNNNKIFLSKAYKPNAHLLDILMQLNYQIAIQTFFNKLLQVVLK